MRSLVVAYEYPWPVNSGSRHRLSTTLHALCGCGPTRLLSITPAARTDFDPPDPALGLEDVRRVRAGPAPGALGLVTHPTLPSAMPVGVHQEVRGILEDWAGELPDVAWYFDLRAWVLGRTPLPIPAVLDLDDLEHHKIRGRLSLETVPGSPAAPGPPPSPRGERWRHLPGRALARLDAARWARLARIASRQAGRTVVCSDLDATRAIAAGIERVAIVPNAYGRPAHPAGRPARGSPPVVLFHGTLRYPPNADAARWLVHTVGPALRALVPDVRIRLAGQGNPGLADLDDPPTTTMVGPVPDMASELALADVVIVPIRYGSGTRVKIIEAFAHRIPVVATTMGAEGLGVVDGQELLLADTAEGLASACARLLEEPGLRARLVDAAEAHYLRCFERDVVAGQVIAAARAAMAEGAPVTRS